jgi:hypothetical protein
METLVALDEQNAFHFTPSTQPLEKHLASAGDGWPTLAAFNTNSFQGVRECSAFQDMPRTATEATPRAQRQAEPRKQTSALFMLF